MSADELKKEFRKKFSGLRKALSPVEHLVLDGAIAARLVNADWFVNADVIAGYAADCNEVNINGVLKIALQQGKKVALPRYIEEEKVYHLLLVQDMERDLERGKYDLPEPRKDLEKAVFTERSIALVPALAFDDTGMRLGRGGGFYDRMLENFPGKKIGVFYQCQHSADALPYAEHDIKLDLAVTEEKVYKF